MRGHVRTAGWVTIVGLASAAGAASLVALLGSDLDAGSGSGSEERHDDW